MPEVNGRLKNTKNVFVDVLLPAHFFARSFHGLCLKRAEQVDDERVFDHGHDLFFCLHMFHLWAKTKASSTMRVSGEVHECSLRNFLWTVTPQFWNVGFLAQSMWGTRQIRIEWRLVACLSRMTSPFRRIFRAIGDLRSSPLNQCMHMYVSICKHVWHVCMFMVYVRM